MKLGDVVSLKSGGPWMTVTRTTTIGGLVYCTWFILETFEVRTSNFPQESLNLLPTVNA